MLEAPYTEPGSFENYPSLSADELFKAKGHLYKSLEIIEEQLGGFKEGIYDALRATSDLSECWLQVNKCRLYTENILAFEECLQPAMGLIYDAKCMVDHLAAKKMGLTRYGRISIMQALNEAAALIAMVLRDLEFWDTEEEKEEDAR